MHMVLKCYPIISIDIIHVFLKVGSECSEIIIEIFDCVPALRAFLTDRSSSGLMSILNGIRVLHTYLRCSPWCFTLLSLFLILNSTSSLFLSQTLSRYPARSLCLSLSPDVHALCQGFPPGCSNHGTCIMIKI